MKQESVLLSFLSLLKLNGRQRFPDPVEELPMQFDQKFICCPDTNEVFETIQLEILSRQEQMWWTNMSKPNKIRGNS